jgi:monothiol glutaredoxin
MLAHIFGATRPVRHGPARASALLLVKGDLMSEQAVQDWIRKAVAGSDVVLFMKGTKDFPQCGFSSQVAQILAHMGVHYRDINVLEDMGIREGIKSFSQWPTIPQLYVKGEFVGGCDIVREMFQAGELDQLFDEKGVPHNSAKLTA